MRRVPKNGYVTLRDLKGLCLILKKDQKMLQHIKVNKQNG